MTKTYTPVEAAEVLKCSADQVRALIASGRLHATNTSLGSQRARWVITQASIDAFLQPVATKKPTRRRPAATSRRWI